MSRRGRRDDRQLFDFALERCVEGQESRRALVEPNTAPKSCDRRAAFSIQSVTGLGAADRRNKFCKP
jgi:hypothetical protein